MTEHRQAYIFTFANTSAAIGAEKATMSRGLAAELIPVPVAIAGDCGFCLRIPSVGAGLAELNTMRALASALKCAALWIETDLAADGMETFKRGKQYERISTDC